MSNEEKKLKERKAILENDLAEIEEMLENIETSTLLSEDTQFNLKSALEEVSGDLIQELEEVDFDLEDFQEEEGVSGNEG